MLERARATSLALLGVTAAVGLAIVALALNQGWPLLEGSAIPPAPRENVGKASVVARPARVAPVQTTGRRRSSSGRAHGGGASARPHAAVVTPSGGEGATTFAVSEQAPAGSPDAASKPQAPPTHGNTPPSPSQPTQAPTGPPPAAPTSSPPPQESAPPLSPVPPPAPPPAQPEAVASEAPPEESNVPSWSHGNGHAYGRDDDEHGHGRGDEGH